jgi:hypothetical protein
MSQLPTLYDRALEAYLRDLLQEVGAAAAEIDQRRQELPNHPPVETVRVRLAAQVAQASSELANAKTPEMVVAVRAHAQALAELARAEEAAKSAEVALASYQELGAPLRSILRNAS